MAGIYEEKYYAPNLQGTILVRVTIQCSYIEVYALLTSS